MARLRCNHALSLLAVLAVVWAAPALAAEAPTGLYDRPVLVLESGDAHGPHLARRCRRRGPLRGHRVR